MDQGRHADGRDGSGPDVTGRLAREDATIAAHGASLCLVAGPGEPTGFVYTVGLAEKGMPEFIFVGSSMAQSGSYLDGFVEAALSGADLRPGRFEPESGPNRFGVPAHLVEADGRLDSHAWGVRSRLARIGSAAVPRLLQVVMPDMRGRFPWDDGYDWLDQDVGRPADAAG